MKGRRVPQKYKRTTALMFTFTVIYTFLSPSMVTKSYITSRHAKGSIHPFNGIDYMLPFPVYYINMDGSEDRRKRTELLFGNLWDLQRSPAVAGSDPEALMKLLGVETYQRVADYIHHERYNDETVAWNEAGCALSHLITIRKAYLESHDMVMIIEDDVSPALMPFWSSSIVKLIDEADRMNSSTPWSLIQAGWTWGQDPEIYVKNRPRPGRQLFQERFQWGTFAYIINRCGMETLLDAYFSDRSQTGLVRLLDVGEVAESYFNALEAGIYVALPSLFVIQGGESTIAGGQEYRTYQHLHSNSVHTNETLQFIIDHLGNQSTAPVPASASAPSRFLVSTNGACGASAGICPAGLCCSQYGWCGTTSAYCDFGCNRLHGSCSGMGNVDVVPAGVAIYKCNLPGVVALTFDDGPAPATSAIMDILKAKAASATFYVSGHILNGVLGLTSRRAEVMRAYAEGHMIGIHDTSHADLTTLSTAELISHMTAMKSVIEDVIGKTPRYMRCPFGYYNDNILSVLAAQNLRHTHWTMDPRDWESRDTAAIVDKIDEYLNTVNTSSSGSIILLHDRFDETAAAISPIIDKIRAKGLKLVTVAECMNDKDGAYIA